MASGLQLNVFKVAFFFLCEVSPFLPWVQPFYVSEQEDKLNRLLASLEQMDGNNLVSEFSDIDWPLQTSSKQKLKTKIKPHLVLQFAKIIINRFRLINNYSRL